MSEQIRRYLETLPAPLADEFANWAVFDFAKPAAISLLEELEFHEYAIRLQVQANAADLAQCSMEISLETLDMFLPSKNRGLTDSAKMKYQKAYRAVHFLSYAASNLAKNQLKNSAFILEIERSVYKLTSVYELTIEENRQLMLNKLRELCQREEIDLEASVAKMEALKHAMMHKWRKDRKRKLYERASFGIVLVDALYSSAASNPLLGGKDLVYGWNLLNSLTLKIRFVGYETGNYLEHTGEYSLHTASFASNQFTKDYSLLHVFLKTGDFFLAKVLPKFMILDLHYDRSDWLGYIILVDLSYVVVPPSTGQHSPDGITWVPHIIPSKEGYFGVETAKLELDSLRKYDPDAPYLIATVSHDNPNAMSNEALRSALALDDAVPIIPLSDEPSYDEAHDLLLKMVDVYEAKAGANDYATLARQLIEFNRQERWDLIRQKKK